MGTTRSGYGLVHDLADPLRFVRKMTIATTTTAATTATGRAIGGAPVVVDVTDDEVDEAIDEVEKALPELVVAVADVVETLLLDSVVDAEELL